MHRLDRVGTVNGVDGASALGPSRTDTAPSGPPVGSGTSLESLASEPTTAETLGGGQAASIGAHGGIDSRDPGPEPTSDVVPDSVEAGVQGATSFAAREGVGAAAARTSYEEGVRNLDPTDRAARTALKESARAATPPVSRAIVEAARPDTGPRPGSTASANRSNAGWNRAGQAFGAVGRGAAVVGIGLGAARIATADDKVAESARVAGGVLGGVAAGTGAGMALGALGANPITIGAGAVVGAVVGGIAGEAAVDRMMDRLGAWWGS